MSSTLQISYINEKALNICFGEGICNEINQKVLSFFSFLKIKNHPEIIDLVPTYNTLGIYFSENFIGNFESTILHLHSEFIENGFTEKNNEEELFEILVSYIGVDLENVAKFCNLEVSEVIKIHSEPIYTVAMIGFLPGFPYLMGLDSRLFIPRKNTPELNVKKGSVAIGGNQTGIYSQDSPGGWHIIGTTEQELFFPDSPQKSYLKPGDKIRFIPNKI